MIQTYHVRPEKIILGIAFYGRSVKMKASPQLSMPTLKMADVATFPEEKGTPSYYNIIRKKHLFEEHWDEEAGATYLSGKIGLATFVSYDDVESISLKAAFVRKNQLAGIVIWDITGECIESFPGSGVISSTPLTDAIQKVFDVSVTVSQ